MAMANSPAWYSSLAELLRQAGLAQHHRGDRGDALAGIEALISSFRI